MIKKIILLIIIILTVNLAIKLTYKNCEVNYINVLDVINNSSSNNKYNYIYTVGALPHYINRYYPNEIDRFYNYVNILNSLKKIEYTNLNRHQQYKISIKLLFFYNENNELDFYKLEQFVKYASKYNIMIGIASMHKIDKEVELATFIKLKELGYNNIFITLATYHSDVNKSVDKILKIGGSIRLVKGWYFDGDIKNWSDVTNNYLENAKKLASDKNFHIFATHDFDILNELYKLDEKNMENKEISCFKFNQEYIESQINKFPYKIKNISLYKPYGNVCLSGIFYLSNIDIFSLTRNFIYKGII